MGYTVGNFIISIKNAGMARRKELFLPYSNIAWAIGNCLVRNKFLENILEEKKENRRILHIFLSYKKREPVVADVRIVSKPSLRIYETTSEIARRQIKGALTAIVSNNKGIKTSQEVKKESLGGEVLFEIW